jgi:3-carboxy-cis,cis-muconate cycloisomerase
VPEPSVPEPSVPEPSVSGPHLLDGVLARGPVAAAVSSDALLRALLEAEGALALAGADVGLLPQAAATRISECARTLRPAVADLSRDAAAAGNPVVPLVRELEQAAGPEAGSHVHRGATSQDLMDTAMVLVAARSVDLLLPDLRACADSAAELAAEHRDTVLAGRTLLQQALPTTFGLKAAGWAVGLDGAAARLAAVRAGLPAQLGGAVGTLSAAGPDALALVDAYARRLGLAVPVLAWHTVRLPVADLACALGTTAGVVAKVALDVALLAQSEVGEVAEGAPGRGGSSTLPHKRNPVAAVSARAAARRAPGLVATLLASMEQEHERAAGAWHAEWQPLCDLLSTTGSAASWLSDSLAHLEVDAARMRANLEASGTALGAEGVAAALTDALGRSAAHDLVAAAVAAARRASRPLREELLEQPPVAAVLSAPDLDRLLDPERDVGCAGALVDRALARRGEDRS